MRIALVQMENAGSMRENLLKSFTAIREAAKHKADIVLFPEVHLSEFFPQYPGGDATEYTLTLESDIILQFREECKANHIMAAPNVYLQEENDSYDASVLIGCDGRIIGVQKMVHVAQAEQFYEQDYYTPSDDGFHVFSTEFGKIGIVVCFDRHYPESIRTEALQGADIILIPTVNTKAEPGEMFEWELRIQAFQNSVALAMCNRVGVEGEMEFSGESIVVDANGEVVVKANSREQIVYADIDLQDVKKIRSHRPYTQLRRPEWYV